MVMVEGTVMASLKKLAKRATQFEYEMAYRDIWLFSGKEPSRAQVIEMIKKREQQAKEKRHG